MVIKKFFTLLGILISKNMENFNLQFLQAELSRVSDWIKFSDQKAAFLSACYSIIFGLAISQKESIIQHLIIYQKWIICFYVLAFFGVIVSFFVGVFFLFKSIFPRLKNAFTDKSLFYFGHVSDMKLVDYLEEVNKLTKDEAKKQIAEQIYTNSVIADQKMKNIQKSIKSFIFVVFFMGLLILI